MHNWQCFSCSIASDARLANRQRFPTTLTFASVDGFSPAAATEALITRFNWRIMLFVCDELSNNLQIAPFYNNLCKHALQGTRCRSAMFECKENRIDSARSTSYQPLLDYIRNQARSKQYQKLLFYRVNWAVDVLQLYFSTRLQTSSERF